MHRRSNKDFISPHWTSKQNQTYFQSFKIIRFALPAFYVTIIPLNYLHIWSQVWKPWNRKVALLNTVHVWIEGLQLDCCDSVLPGCPVQVERRGLEAHLSECRFRSRECPNGCGHTLHSVDWSQHNCVAELRAEVEMMRWVVTITNAPHKLESEFRVWTSARHFDLPYLPQDRDAV